jgi:hypothetical protein
MKKLLAASLLFVAIISPAAYAKGHKSGTSHPTADHTKANHPTAIHPTAVHPKAIHPAANHPTTQHPSPRNSHHPVQK